MILSQFGSNWFLTSGINRKGRCGLRCGKNMPHDDTFQPLPPTGTQLYGYTDNAKDVVFYPKIYYRGCRVTPRHWQFESAEPILNCFLQPEDIGADLLGGKPVPDYANQFSAFLRLVQEDGWNWDMRDGGTKYIHVDDLEKIEGSPPEGAF